MGIAIYIAKAAKRPPPRRRRVANTPARFAALQKQMSNAVVADLIKGVKTFRKRISSDELYNAWANRDYAHLMKIVPWEKLHEDLEPATDGVGDSIIRGSAAALEALPPNINKHLRFDKSNPAIRRYLSHEAAGLVSYIESDTRQIIQNQIARHFTDTRTPRQIANSIRNSIGLLPKHAAAVDNYHADLLRGGMPPARADALAAQYADRLLDYRAKMIAKTETGMAIQKGQLSVWQEGLNQGYIDREKTRKQWILDGNPCDICISVVDDQPEVAIDEPWIVYYPNGESREVWIPRESHPHCQCEMNLVYT